MCVGIFRDSVILIEVLENIFIKRIVYLLLLSAVLLISYLGFVLDIPVLYEWVE